MIESRKKQQQHFIVKAINNLNFILSKIKSVNLRYEIFMKASAKRLIDLTRIFDGN